MMIIIRKVYSLILLVILTLFCCSCSNSNDSKKIDYSVFTSDEVTDATPTAQVDKSSNEITVTPSADITPDAETRWNWPFDMNFAGVNSEMKDFKLGNLSSNIKINSNGSCLLCPDTQNNVIYYVNVGKGNDKFIYQLKDDVSTLLVDMEANNLQLWDNKLYFIKIQNTKFFASGNLYSYDLATKELKLVLEKNVASFFIDNYGIYYDELVGDSELHVYRFDFNNEITSLDNYPWVIPYNEYLLTILDGSLSLINRNTEEIIKIMPFEDELNVVSTIHIYNDKLIFAVNSCVCLLDLNTGKRKIYDAYDVSDLGKIERVVDLALNGNEIFCTYGSNWIFKINLETDEMKELKLFSLKSNFYYSYLQTNGERLFALVFSFTPPDYIASVSGIDELIPPPGEGNELKQKELGK